MQVLRNTTPTARKGHTCDLCGGSIAIGEKYERQTNKYDGILYDWACHCECCKVAHELDMYDGCDYNGLNSDGFIEQLNRYVYDNHFNEELYDIAKDWQLPYPELVKKVLEELK